MQMTVTKKSLETEPLHWLGEDGSTLCGLVNQRRSTKQEQYERIRCWMCVQEYHLLDENERAGSSDE
jgi:hypothetical protein